MYNSAKNVYIFLEKLLTNVYKCYMICISNREQVVAHDEKDAQQNCLNKTKNIQSKQMTDLV